MKALHFCLFICITLISCSAKRKKQKSPYFNGVIEYSTVSQANSPKDDSAFYKVFGNLETVYIMDSLITRLYHRGGIIVSRQIIRPDSLKEYDTGLAPDTIFVTDLSNSYYYSNISSQEIGWKTILGKHCLGLRTTNKVQGHILSDPETQTTTYWFDTSRHLCPAINKGVRYGSFEVLMAKYPYLTLQCEQTGEGVNVISTATKVTATDVAPVMFEIPPSKVKMDFFLRPVPF